MKKIAFVTPWYGENIAGGAENELRGIVKHLSNENIALEVLTTCIAQFTSDWGENYYDQGIYNVNGITVRRFSVKKRNANVFDYINYKLLNKIKISPYEEHIFIEEMIKCPELYEYIKNRNNEYECFVFIPYMFTTSVRGIEVCPEKAVVIPCFHNEAYIYLDIYKKVFEQCRAFIYLSEPERELANTVFDLNKSIQKVVGAGVNIEFGYNSDRFRRKYGIEDPFIIYAGRKDAGKNIDLLVRYYTYYKKRHKHNPLKLVLIGGGKVRVPASIKSEVLDLGFVEIQDKYDAYSAAIACCQPSVNESFSIVIMESWLVRRPVLVNAGCAVTKNFAINSNGGLYFASYYEFEGCIDFIMNNTKIARIMGENGRNYVLENFRWDIIVKKYIELFEEVGSYAK